MVLVATRKKTAWEMERDLKEYAARPNALLRSRDVRFAGHLSLRSRASTILVAFGSRRVVSGSAESDPAHEVDRFRRAIRREQGA